MVVYIIVLFIEDKCLFLRCHALSTLLMKIWPDLIINAILRVILIWLEACVSSTLNWAKIVFLIINAWFLQSYSLRRVFVLSELYLQRWNTSRGTRSIKKKILVIQRGHSLWKVVDFIFKLIFLNGILYFLTYCETHCYTNRSK